MTANNAPYIWNGWSMKTPGSMGSMMVNNNRIGSTGAREHGQDPDAPIFDIYFQG